MYSYLWFSLKSSSFVCFRIKFPAGSSLAYVIMFYGVLSHEAADNFAVNPTSSVFFHF